MNKLGDIYIAELTDNKIDKSSLRWMLLNKSDIPILPDLSAQMPESFPFNLFLIDSFNLLKQTTDLHYCNKEGDNHAALNVIAPDLNLEFFGKGKPYFSDINLNFSISHTGERRNANLGAKTNEPKKTIWGCAISDYEIGFDLQFLRSVKYCEIAEKYFSTLENEFIRKHGIDGFFQIWTRREAFGKAVGDGFFVDDNDFMGSVGEDFELLQEIKYKGKNFELFTHRFSDDLWGSCCIVKMQ